MRSRFHPVVWGILVLAAVGFFYQLRSNPAGILALIIITGVLFLLLRNYTKTGRFLTFSAKKPKSKGKPFKPGLKRSTRTERKDIPFQVIQGKKGQKKEKQTGS
ncbi:hypothetical protein [Brevibacillus daliensis]|uniref:hypothetical protein n=1 Tax=Brevibacillus daliensis TaxID=2892995 RepID=UPI001E2E4C56|nr:hypothetical protein [Brevibacillus daliensis]